MKSSDWKQQEKKVQRRALWLLLAFFGTLIITQNLQAKDWQHEREHRKVRVEKKHKHKHRHERRYRDSHRHEYRHDYRAPYVTHYRPRYRAYREPRVIYLQAHPRFGEVFFHEALGFCYGGFKRCIAVNHVHTRFCPKWHRHTYAYRWIDYGPAVAISSPGFYLRFDW